jgi:hypothetical protein
MDGRQSPNRVKMQIPVDKCVSQRRKGIRDGGDRIFVFQRDEGMGCGFGPPGAIRRFP